MSGPTSNTPESPKAPFYTRPRFITAVVLSVIFLILILQNMSPVTINVFFMKLQASAALLYLIFSIIGFTVGWLLKRSQAAAKARKQAPPAA